MLRSGGNFDGGDWLCKVRGESGKQTSWNIVVAVETTTTDKVFLWH